MSGYRSKIDGSVQPFGLVIPDGPARAEWISARRLVPRSRRDVERTQFHRRTNHTHRRIQPAGNDCPASLRPLLQRQQIRGRDRRARSDRCGEVAATRSIPTASRFADFPWESASAWQFAVHYPDHWFAANPGAGFSETPRFLNVFQRETLQPTWYEKKLWHLYDCTDVAENIWECPTVAYSGELDNQKQAADVMAEALEKVGLELTHVIGPKTKHAYHPAAKAEVERKMADLRADRSTGIPQIADLRHLYLALQSDELASR